MPQNINKTKSFFLKKALSEPEIGFTTGTCAAAGSVAAMRMLLTGEIVPYVILSTPKGIKVCIEIENQSIEKDHASCSVQKFSGTDPDVTNGIEIFACVRKVPSDKMVTNFQRSASLGTKSEIDGVSVRILGGDGVGRVTLPGLDQKPGEAAINSVPRKMILEGLASEIKRYGKNSLGGAFGLEVEISVPNGEKIASQTFNPKLGIVSGISILGTSGIVEPMSEQAILDTIQLEINMRKAQGREILAVVPGNYGADFLQAEFGFSPETAVHCSNFVYDSVQMAVKTGFKKMLFCGHVGKLVKVAAGVKNTHSKYGDKRMEILCDVAKNLNIIEDFDSFEERLMSCITTEQAIHVLDLIDEGKTRNLIMREVVRRIRNQIYDWTDRKIDVEVIIFTKESGLLGKSEGVSDFIAEMGSDSFTDIL
ncbi:cobalt-precorrin-5B (C(1))-methyltransferase CbiD [uncultured Treponema sp.]|uniref:cobalt-precorrin-5B (C(1))-methyltransferase CbiD n=1 Tax=uncultured Treponema sp. TaxID=162155 RepID=UPI0025CD923F|nr:cobalt-precorrin-5B (C(1))-methyltransferase CbiD [uncultured Treponema sp.]